MKTPKPSVLSLYILSNLEFLTRFSLAMERYQTTAPSSKSWWVETSHLTHTVRRSPIRATACIREHATMHSGIRTTVMAVHPTNPGNAAPASRFRLPPPRGMSISKEDVACYNGRSVVCNRTVREKFEGGVALRALSHFSPLSQRAKVVRKSYS